MPATTDAGARRAALTPLATAWLLAALLGLQPVTTDLYLPALPALTRALGTQVAAAQLTMSAMILAFGIGQLVWGPVSDRFGRRRSLLWGVGLFTLAAAGGALAPHIGLLVAARVGQGLGLAAAVVCARAMVRDLFEPAEGTRVMSLALTGLGVIAFASPSIGGVLAWGFGWRATFVVIALIGAVLWLVLWRRLPETAHALDVQALQPARLARTWRTIAAHPTFRAWALLTAGTYGGLFIVLAGSSYIFIELLGLSPAGYGLVLGLNSAAYIGGTFLCRHWIARHGITATVARGAGFTLAGGLGMAGAAALGLQSVATVLGPMLLFAIGHGIHQPCGQAGAVGPFPRAAGAASALAGFTLAFIAFLIGQWLGQALDGTLQPFAYGFALTTIATVTVAWSLVQRHGVLQAQAA